MLQTALALRLQLLLKLQQHYHYLVGHQQARQQEDTNLAGSVRQSIYTKTGTPVRQVGRLGPGVTVPEK